MTKRHSENTELGPSAGSTMAVSLPVRPNLLIGRSARCYEAASASFTGKPAETDAERTSRSSFAIPMMISKFCDQSANATVGVSNERLDAHRPFESTPIHYPVNNQQQDQDPNNDTDVVHVVAPDG
jgi:hypothetical protein